jgi:nitrate reductase gamma subunit
MSLKNFHVVFIVAATVLVVFCAVQALQQFLSTGSPGMAVAFAGAVAGVVLLVRYEALFLRRCREEGIR